MFDQAWIDYLNEQQGIAPMQPMMPPGSSIMPAPPGVQPWQGGDSVLPPELTPPPYPTPDITDPSKPWQEASMGGGLGLLNSQAMGLGGGSQGSGTGILSGLFGGGGGSQYPEGKDWGGMLMALGGGIASGAAFGGGGWGGGIGRGLQGAAGVSQRQKENSLEERLARERMAQAEKIAKIQAQDTVSGQYGTPLIGMGQDKNKYVGALRKGAKGGIVWYDQSGKEVSDGREITVLPGVTWQDFDNYRQPFDNKTGDAAGPPIPREREDANRQDARGTELGKVDQKLSSLQSKLPGLQGVVSELDVLANEATYTKAGQWYNYGKKELGFGSTEGGVARARYQAIVDNQILPLLVDTYGPQFTLIEGENLKKTLGDPDKTPAEKQVVLKAFIEQKNRDVQSLAAQAGGQSPGGGAAPVYKKYNPATGKIE
jgi:hypothetical protein